MEQNGRKAVRYLYFAGNLVVRVVGSAIFLLLAWYSFWYTQYMLPGGRELPVDVRDSGSRNLMGLAVAAGIMAGLLLVEKYMDSRRQAVLRRWALAATLLWIAGAGIWWLSSSAHVPVGDQAFIYGGASYFIEGDYGFLDTGAYFAMHPYQLGLTAFCELLFRVAGAYNYRAFQILNLILAVGSVYLGYRVLAEMTRSTAALLAYDILMIGCLPLIFYTPWVYGDIPSIFFALLAEWMLLRYLAEHRKRHLAILALSLALAMLVRKNSLILLVAAGLTVLLHALLHRDRRILITFLLALALSYGSYEAIYKMYEIRSGIEHDDGLPTIAWVTMGMMENYGRYGWYNDYPKELYFRVVEGDKRAMAKYAEQDLEERLRAFGDDREYAELFFKQKLLSQWNEPLYQALYFNAESPEAEGGPARGSLAAGLHGEHYFKALAVCDRWQMIVYAGMLCYFLLAVRKDSNILQHTLAVTMIGGFLFSIIYEAKARYIFPYYVFMFPYAAMGFRLAAGYGAVLVRRCLKGRRAAGTRKDRKAR